MNESGSWSTSDANTVKHEKLSPDLTPLAMDISPIHISDHAQESTASVDPNGSLTPESWPAIPESGHLDAEHPSSDDDDSPLCATRRKSRKHGALNSEDDEMASGSDAKTRLQKRQRTSSIGSSLSLGGILVGSFMGTSVTRQDKMPSIYGILDTAGEVRYVVRPITRDGSAFEGVIPLPGGRMKTRSKIVQESAIAFEPHLAGLTTRQRSAYVRNNLESETSQIGEDAFDNEDSVEQSQSQRYGGDELIFVGFWKGRTRRDGVRYPVSSFIGKDKRIRYKIHLMGDEEEKVFYTPSGRSIIAIDAVDLKPHLVNLSKDEIKEYVRIREERIREGMEYNSLSTSEQQEADTRFIKAAKLAVKARNEQDESYDDSTTRIYDSHNRVMRSEQSKKLPETAEETESMSPMQTAKKARSMESDTSSHLRSQNGRFSTTLEQEKAEARVNISNVTKSAKRSNEGCRKPEASPFLELYAAYAKQTRLRREEPSPLSEVVRNKTVAELDRKIQSRTRERSEQAIDQNASTQPETPNTPKGEDSNNTQIPSARGISQRVATRSQIKPLTARQRRTSAHFVDYDEERSEESEIYETIPQEDLENDARTSHSAQKSTSTPFSKLSSFASTALGTEILLGTHTFKLKSYPPFQGEMVSTTSTIVSIGGHDHLQRWLLREVPRDGLVKLSDKWYRVTDAGIVLDGRDLHGVEDKVLEIYTRIS